MNPPEAVQPTLPGIGPAACTVHEFAGRGVWRGCVHCWWRGWFGRRWRGGT